ncbi:W2 eIF5 [Drosophila suzukii associated hytrosavirus 1]|nr:W2 eIF5 [Drosophila suzukii associated hytrosavirus 1]
MYHPAITSALCTYSSMDFNQRYDKFKEIVCKKISTCDLDSPATQNYLLIQALCMGMVERAPLVLSELLLTKYLEEDIKRYSSVLQHFCGDNIIAQRFLIGGIEQIIAKHSEELLPRVSAIFKTLYDEDILDKNVIIEWYESHNYVTEDVAREISKKSEPLVQYLKKSEDEYIDELFSILN